MADITATMVKDLRDMTGAGMMDCKKALTETSGDIEAAIDWLRKKGLAAAAKKAGRTAAEGLVGVVVTGTKGAVVEVNSETDFVAKNEIFQGFVKRVTEISLGTGADIAALGAAAYGDGKSVSEVLTANIATIGENQSLRRAAILEVTKGAVAAYTHNAAAPGLGKIGVLVALESEADADMLTALGKQLAMHIAAANPLALDETGIDPAVLAREKDIALDKARQAGKPEEMLEKIAGGAVNKFKTENTLLGQVFVIDGKSKIADVLAAAAKDAGKPIALKAFVRFQLGEGIEKEDKDFAAEVAAAMGN
jgi:elongation factor Ts